jgi:hypothetical protein
MEQQEMINLEKVQKYDVVLVSSKSIVGRLIQKATKFEYNHVGIVVPFNGTLWIAEAVAQGFKLTHTLTDYQKIANKKGKKLLFLRSKIEVHENTIKERISFLMNKKYEFANLVFFQLFKQFTKKWIGTKNANRVICSEAVAYCFQEYFPKWYKVEPEEFYYSQDFRQVLETK